VAAAAALKASKTAATAAAAAASNAGRAAAAQVGDCVLCSWWMWTVDISAQQILHDPAAGWHGAATGASAMTAHGLRMRSWLLTACKTPYLACRPPWRLLSIP
jgi:hypothetical protein